MNRKLAQLISALNCCDRNEVARLAGELCRSITAGDRLACGVYGDRAVADRLFDAIGFFAILRR